MLLVLLFERMSVITAMAIGEAILRVFFFRAIDTRVRAEKDCCDYVLGRSDSNC